MTGTVLFVDDEPNVLAGFERQLRKRFAVATAVGGEAGIAALASGPPVAVVVSDMRMPGADGVRVLAEAKRVQPDAVRILLTGYAELSSAIAAVNEGSLFRFLVKPCPPETLAATLDAALAQYQLVTAEKDLLDRTLRGCVQVLGEVLALVNPDAFGRTVRVQHVVRELARVLPAAGGWEVDVAAVLSELGAIAVPADVLAAADAGRVLSDGQLAQLAAGTRVAGELLAKIPRLDAVAAITTARERAFDAAGHPTGAAIPFGSRLLKLVRDYDALLTRGVTARDAVSDLRARVGRYDPDLLTALERWTQGAAAAAIREVAIAELEAGMHLAESLYSQGSLLLAGGARITDPIRHRLATYAAAGRIAPRLRVVVAGPKR